MKEWLQFFLMNLIRRLMGSKSAPSADDIDDGEVKKVEVVEEIFCPICGEKWDEGEIFCYACGYEIKDEELPLHPPPEKTGALVDPDGLIGEPIKSKFNEELKSLGASKSSDIVVFIVPQNLAKFLDPSNAKPENLDGMAYALYNTWQIGKTTGLKGLMIAIDPGRENRALVIGRNGPNIDGLKFREWYGGLKLSDELLNGELVAPLAFEVGYLIDRLKESM
jgi:hypothetical protein